MMSHLLCARNVLMARWYCVSRIRFTAAIQPSFST